MIMARRIHMDWSKERTPGHISAFSESKISYLPNGGRCISHNILRYLSLSRRSGNTDVSHPALHFHASALSGVNEGLIRKLFQSSSRASFVTSRHRFQIAYAPHSQLQIQRGTNYRI